MTEFGRDVDRLWSAYAISTYGTWIAFGAFPLIAVGTLQTSACAVSLLESVGLAAAAICAVAIGPRIAWHRKRPAMIGADCARFVAMASIPPAYLAGVLTYGQLLVVSIIGGTASIASTAASGAYLKHIVPAGRLLAANGRFEGAMWIATATGPPLGGLAIAVLGPVVTVAADAASYAVSALTVGRIRGADVATPSARGDRRWAAELIRGWSVIATDRVLRRLFVNQMAVNGLIMATGPLLAVLLIGEYHYAAWEYGLAFGLPGVAGFVGARLSAHLVERHGRDRVLTISGWLRSVVPLGLAAVQPGVPGLVTVIVVEALLIGCMGVFNPIGATERLRRVRAEDVPQVLAAWSITSRLSQATLIALWGALATLADPLSAITASGVLLLATPLLLPRRRQLGQSRTEPESDQN
ncbi:putative major facilitator superfamily transporter [Gordonia soli NBRC 108243]|uniref:Putative major facilitator superfamily transporter n=1 Tax=Gordonia soli NBRC 108243 TaxID=1223545 RepID=M0QFG4_9ACTN|nr:putative major facilitator superfamily transporter [Gordonia soli NBRC 108243]